MGPYGRNKHVTWQWEWFCSDFGIRRRNDDHHQQVCSVGNWASEHCQLEAAMYHLCNCIFQGGGQPERMGRRNLRNHLQNWQKVTSNESCKYRTKFRFIYFATDTITRNSSGDEIANVNFLFDDIVHPLRNTIDSCINLPQINAAVMCWNACLPNLVK